MLLATLGLPPRYARVQPCGLISRCGRWSVRVARYARLPRSLRSRVSIRIDFSLELCGYYAIINTQLCHTISATMPATSPLYFSAYFTRQLFQQHYSAPQLLLMPSNRMAALRALNAIASLHAPRHCYDSASLCFAVIVAMSGRLQKAVSAGAPSFFKRSSAPLPTRIRSAIAY